jgi:hypothetical protein
MIPADVTFDTQPYAADGGFSIGGVVIMLLGMGAAGIAMGALAYFISQWFYLILLFPIAIGAVIGLVGAGLVHIGKVRAPWLAGLTGLLAGILAMLTMHYLEYNKFQGEIENNRQAAQLGMNFLPKEEKEQVRRLLEVKSFPAYIDAQAHEGVTIKRGGGGGRDKGLNLGYYGSYIYWLVEMCIVAGIVLYIAKDPARKPFCVLSNEWKTECCGDNFAVPEQVGVTAVVDALKEGAIGKLAQLKMAARESAATTIPVRLYVYASPQHSEATLVDVKLSQFVTTKEGKQEEKELTMVTYPAKSLETLEQLCKM